MATEDLNGKPCDPFWRLFDAYESLALLAHSENGGSDPVYSLLLFLNEEFRRALDEVDSQGLLS